MKNRSLDLKEIKQPQSMMILLIVSIKNLPTINNKKCIIAVFSFFMVVLFLQNLLIVMLRLEQNYHLESIASLQIEIILGAFYLL